MSNEQTSVDSVKKPTRGRRKKGVSADNIHEIVSSLSDNDCAYLKKESYRYDIRARTDLEVLLNELFQQGYRSYKSPASVNKSIERLLEKLADDNIDEVKKRGFKAEIELKKSSAYPVKEEDVEKLQKAIDEMGSEFWKRIQGKMRQAKHKEKSLKNQISVDGLLFSNLSDEKLDENWNDFLYKALKSYKVVSRLMQDYHCTGFVELVDALEEYDVINKDQQNKILKAELSRLSSC